jgi:hypothetical protein
MGLVPGNWESRMTIAEIIRQGLYYARTCRSLWLFGFFVGIASGGSNGGGGGGRADNAGGVVVGGLVAGGGFDLSGTGFTGFNGFALIATILVLVLVVFTVMRFVGEGALIEGVARARQGGAMTMREGLRAGLAHWFVLVRIALLYVAVSIGSVVLLAVPCVIALSTLGSLGAVLLGLPALIIAVPWLVTLYLVQAFAWRIAVLENRRAIDAIEKARLFLHGRLIHGLKLIVAMFVGTLGLVIVGVVAIAPVALLLMALIPVLHVVPVIVLACLVLLPVMYVFAAIVGTFRSSVWTIGYVTQVTQVES